MPGEVEPAAASDAVSLRGCEQAAAALRIPLLFLPQIQQEIDPLIYAILNQGKNK